MDWMKILSEAIDFMEEHLMEPIDAEAVAASVNTSSFYFQKGFKIITGYSVGEYIRNRRLYLAALDIFGTDNRIIDISMKYGYETPESFSKAFSRFHGVSPVQVKNQVNSIQPFLPLNIKLSVEGGRKLEVDIVSMNSFKIIGIEGTFEYENAFRDIPPMWNYYIENYMERCCREYKNCNIGKYGVNLGEDGNNKTFRYLIAGDYHGGEIPEGMKVIEIPKHTWAKFHCTGPMPGALQALNSKIFSEWLPGNGTYEIAAPINIELYTFGDIHAPGYESGIWIPVKRI